MPGMSFHKGYSHITSKALTGKISPRRSARACHFGDRPPKLCKEKERTAHKRRLKNRWRHPSVDVLGQFSNRVPGARNWFETMLGKRTKGTEQGWSLS